MLLEKIEKIQNAVSEKYKTLQAKIKQNYKLAVVLVVGALVLGVVLLLVEAFRGWFFLGVLGLVFLFEKLTYVKPDYSYNQYFSVLAPQILESVTYFCNSDPVYYQVKSTEDITNFDYMYNDFENAFKFFLVKKEAISIDAERLSALGYKIENRINQRLRNMATCNIPSFDNLSPKIGVVSVEDKGGEVELSIFIANNPKKRQKLATLRKERQDVKRVVTADVDKTDDDF